jgi:hypothetical protein
MAILIGAPIGYIVLHPRFKKLLDGFKPKNFLEVMSIPYHGGFFIKMHTASTRPKEYFERWPTSKSGRHKDEMYDWAYQELIIKMKLEPKSDEAWQAFIRKYPLDDASKADPLIKKSVRKSFYGSMMYRKKKEKKQEIK